MLLYFFWNFKIFKFCIDLYPLAAGEYMLENDPLIVGVGIAKVFNKKFIKYSWHLIIFNIWINMALIVISKGSLELAQVILLTV